MKNELKEAVHILRHFQDWRRGYDCRTMNEIGIAPRQIGKAIDVILDHHGEGKPLVNCEECKDFDIMFGQCKLKRCIKEKG